MKTRVLFVCLGNICRSPLGEGVFRHLVSARGLDDSFDVLFRHHAADLAPA